MGKKDKTTSRDESDTNSLPIDTEIDKLLNFKKYQQKILENLTKVVTIGEEYSHLLQTTGEGMIEYGDILQINDDTFLGTIYEKLGIMLKMVSEVQKSVHNSITQNFIENRLQSINTIDGAFTLRKRIEKYQINYHELELKMSKKSKISKSKLSEMENELLQVKSAKKSCKECLLNHITELSDINTKEVDVILKLVQKYSEYFETGRSFSSQIDELIRNDCRSYLIEIAKKYSAVAEKTKSSSSSLTDDRMMMNSSTSTTSQSEGNHDIENIPPSSSPSSSATSSIIPEESLELEELQAIVELNDSSLSNHHHQQYNYSSDDIHPVTTSNGGSKSLPLLIIPKDQSGGNNDDDNDELQSNTSTQNTSSSSSSSSSEGTSNNNHHATKRKSKSPRDKQRKLITHNKSKPDITHTPPSLSPPPLPPKPEVIFNNLGEPDIIPSSSSSSSSTTTTTIENITISEVEITSTHLPSSPMMTTKHSKPKGLKKSKKVSTPEVKIFVHSPIHPSIIAISSDNHPHPHPSQQQNHLQGGSIDPTPQLEGSPNTFTSPLNTTPLNGGYDDEEALLNQIITSETAYLQSLRTLKLNYYDPFISEFKEKYNNDRDIFFSNLLDIYHFQTLFTERLLECKNTWPSLSILKILSSHADGLRVYMPYLVNYSLCLNMIEKKLKIKPWSHFFANCNQNSKGGVSFLALIQLPTIAFASFQDHIKIYQTKAKTEEEIEEAKITLNIVKKIEEEVNIKAMTRRKSSKLFSIQDKLINFTERLDEDKRRELVKEGAVQVNLNSSTDVIAAEKSKSNNYLFLFSDFLLFTKPTTKTAFSSPKFISHSSKEGKYKVLLKVEFLNMKLDEYADNEYLQLEVTEKGVGVKGVGDDVKRITLFFSNKSLKQSWCEAISRQLDLCAKLKVFGRPLEEIVRKEQNEVIPGIIEIVSKHLIETEAYLVEGLIRVPGNMRVLSFLRSQLDKGLPISLSHVDPHTSCGLLKLFLRELPDPLLVNSHPSLSAICDMNDEEEKIKEYRKHFNSLPDVLKFTSETVFALFHLIANFAAENKMSARNISTIMSTIMLSRQITLSLNSSSNSIKIFDDLILFYPQIFSDIKIEKEMIHKSKANVDEQNVIDIDEGFLLEEGDNLDAEKNGSNNNNEFWDCPSCTLRNHPLLKRCELCDTPQSQ